MKELSGDEVAQIVTLKGTNRSLSAEDLSAYVAAEASQAILLSGDKRLRNLAQSYGVKVHGTIWIMGELIDGKVITKEQAKDCLRMMREKGSRIPLKICEKYFGPFY